MNEKQIGSWLDRPIVKGLGLSWEQGFYLLIILVCLVSRLAILGVRVQSHDESLHTKYSWNLYDGQGFQHNPMMHGPFLFHITAASYALFGDTDFTARLPVALLGTLLVAFPYLLRRYLGRKAALLSSLLLLISPSIMYYSRYIRHDIPIILWSMIAIWAIFHYIEQGKVRYLYILAGGVSLMYATKEVAAIYVIFFAVFLIGLFLVEVLREPWERRELEVRFLVGLAVTLVGLTLLALGWAVGRPEEGGPPPVWAIIAGAFALVGLVFSAITLWTAQSGRLRTLRSFDLIVLIGTLSLPFASPLLMHAASRVGSFIVSGAPASQPVSPLVSGLANLEILNYEAPHIYYSGAILGLVIAAAIAIGLVWDWRRWAISAAVYMVIFLILYTTIFTHGGGIASGWVGSVGYWLEQQEVQRGGQPWYYYFIVLPLYDFLPLIGALLVPLYLLIRRLVAGPGHQDGAERPAPSLTPMVGRDWPLFIAFVGLWAVLSWLAYTYAGEKMPWLVVHISLPMILLTGWLLGQLIEAVDWRRVWDRRGWLLFLLLPALVAALASAIRAGVQGPFRGVELNALLTTGDFLAGLVGIVLLGVIVGWLWSRIGARNGMLVTLLTGFLVLGLLTVRIGYRFSFVNFDYPTEFLVYAHESNNVRETMEQLEELSLRVAGGPRLIDVAFGPEGSWPFYWYLRDYPNAQYYPEEPSRDQVLKTAVIAGQPQWDAVEPYLGDNYYAFDYNFLWWPIEDYKQLTWEKVGDWLTDPQKLAALWQIFYNRDYTLYGEITDQTLTLDEWPLRREYRLYIRKDVVNRLWDFGVGPAPEEDMELELEIDPYEEGLELRSAVASWGSEGTEPGQFFWPRGIATSPDGFVYVADSRNHRIQRFATDGTFIDEWGSYGECGMGVPGPGTFCEPWDVAVAPDGSVYVADTWAHRIQHFTAEGEFLGEWGSFGESQVGDPGGEGLFYGPRALAVGPDGSVYVADTGNKRIQVFDAGGTFLREFGGQGRSPGQLDEPVGLAFTPEGRLIVADSWNFRIQVLETDGQPVHSWTVEGWDNIDVEEKPYVAVDDQGQVYVTDPGHYRVWAFDSQGTYLYSFGRYGDDAMSFALPMGVAVGPDGRLYVTDAANHRLMVFERR
jgi:uncharacterized protein (TIGR03663 family)